MKLFSRKAVAAVATTVALTAAGLSTPAMAAETTDPTAGIVQQVSEFSSADEGTDYQNNRTRGNDDSDGSSNASEITGWVGVFTAVIGALSTAFTFVQKLNPTAA